MAESKYRTKETQWIKEQNGVATKFGWVNRITGEQLTAEKGLVTELDIVRPNVPPAAGGGVGGVGGQVEEEDRKELSPPPVPAITFKQTTAEVTAQLNTANNDAGHEFELGEFENVTKEGALSVALSDNSGSTWKVQLKDNTVNQEGGYKVKAVLKRYRKDQEDDVNEDVTIKLTLDGAHEFTANLKLSITV